MWVHTWGLEATSWAPPSHRVNLYVSLTVTVTREFVCQLDSDSHPWVPLRVPTEGGAEGTRGCQGAPASLAAG